MPKIYHAAGSGARLGEAIGADGDIRTQLAGDIHLVSLDGKYFYPFARRPEPGDYEVLKDLLENPAAGILEFPRGIVERAMGNIEEIQG